MNILEKRVAAMREKLPPALIWNPLGSLTRRARMRIIFSQDIKEHGNTTIRDMYRRSCESFFPESVKEPEDPVMFDHASLMRIFDAMSKYAKLMVFY